MSLKNTLAEIKRLKPIAEEDVNSGAPETLNARRGRKNQAVEALKRLRREYKTEMQIGSVFLISTGSSREETTKQIVEAHKWFQADPENFYADLAKRVAPALYLNKTSVSNVFDVLGRHLEDKMMELDINEYNQLIFKAEYAEKISSQEEFTRLIKKAINNQIGSEIVGIQSIEGLVDQAIEQGHDKPIMPIVLTTNDTDLIQSLVKDLPRLTSQVFVIGSGEVENKIKNLDGAIVLEDNSAKAIKAALNTLKKSKSK